MDSIEWVWLGAVVLCAAFMQGLGGVGFSLIAAPAVTQSIGGSGGVGAVNLAALSQNLYQMWRETGHIHWGSIKLLAPGLVVGYLIGVAATMWLPPNVMPVVVATSSLASLGALLWWRPKNSRRNRAAAGMWGGAVNTYAGVGGPPLATFMIGQQIKHGTRMRTQQTIFATLNAASIPILGLPPLNIPTIVGAAALIVCGAWAGMKLRGKLAEKTAITVAQVAICVVAGAALVRSVALLVA